jgi:hypothetical protein
MSGTEGPLRIAVAGGSIGGLCAAIHPPALPAGPGRDLCRLRRPARNARRGRRGARSRALRRRRVHLLRGEGQHRLLDRHVLKSDPRSDRTTAVSGGAQCSSAIADMTLFASERLPMSTALVRTSDWNWGPRKRLCNENLHRMSEQIRVDGVQGRLATMLAHPDEENACWVA